MNSTRQIDLNAVLLFAAVAETGGFTAAAEQLGVAKAKVSVEVGRLEQRLGVSLFTRTTRRVTLTDAGQALLAECVPLLRGAQEAMGQLGGAAELAGPLRISTAVDHAVQSMSGAVAEFAALHPRVSIDLRASDRVTDLVKEGIDVAIRMGWLRDSSLRATRLGEFAQYVVASPAYLARAGMPRAPRDLVGHDWIALSLLPTPLTWKFSASRGRSQTVRMQSRLRSDSSATLRSLLLHGAGVSAVDQFSVAESLRTGQLVRLLPQWSLPQGGVYAVLPPGRHVPAKVRAFIDFYRAFLERRAAP